MLAYQGNANAQYNLGVCYVNGEGVAQDDEQAIKYYRLAADQGHAGAQYNLGNYYENGESVAQDIKQAIKYYQLAADQGHVDAKEALTRLHKQKLKNISLGNPVNFYKKADFKIDRDFSKIEKEKYENVNYLNYQRSVCVSNGI